MSKENKHTEVDGLFAFWEYENYFLGGKITMIDDCGQVFCPSYQAWFNPVKILPVQQGLKLADEIDTLVYNTKAKTKSFNKELETKSKELLGIK